MPGPRWHHYLFDLIGFFVALTVERVIARPIGEGFPPFACITITSTGTRLPRDTAISDLMIVSAADTSSARLRLFFLVF
jgi:hypothetical protein